MAFVEHFLRKTVVIPSGTLQSVALSARLPVIGTNAFAVSNKFVQFILSFLTDRTICIDRVSIKEFQFDSLEIPKVSGFSSSLIIIFH